MEEGAEQKTGTGWRNEPLGIWEVRDFVCFFLFVSDDVEKSGWVEVIEKYR